MADSAANRISWQQYDLRVNRFLGSWTWGGPGTNNWLNDPAPPVALYTFDGGSLVDSFNAQNFVNNPYGGFDNAAPGAGAGQEGSGSLEWHCFEDGGGGGDLGYRWEVTNASMLPTFPGQSTNPSTGAAMCVWVNFEWLSWGGDVWNDAIQGSFRKSQSVGFEWEDGDGFTRPADGSTHRLKIWHDNATTVLPVSLANGQWYHLSISVEDTGSKHVIIKLWDETAQAIVYSLDNTGAGNGALSVSSNPLQMDSIIFGIGSSHKQRFDEAVYFNRAITPTEMSEIRQGTFGA